MNVMNTGDGSARVGEWYVRWDNGELFQVTGYHPERRANSIESFDGEMYELDEATWSALPLALVRPPDGWTTDLQIAARRTASSEEIAEEVTEQPEWASPPEEEETEEFAGPDDILMVDTPDTRTHLR